jgi:hypothetical protein
MPTVLVSALAVRAGDDPYAYAGRRFPARLTVVGLIVMANRRRLGDPTHLGHPVGLAAANTGSLLPLWAAWSWLRTGSGLVFSLQRRSP